MRASNDLRRIADEVARIEHEFQGAVKVTVLRDPRFEGVLGELNVGFCFVGGCDVTLMVMLIYPLQILQQYIR